MLPQPPVVPVPEREMFKLVGDYAVYHGERFIVIPRGFMFDGASIPPFAWQIISTPFHPRMIAPSLVHDWDYYTHEVSREHADKILFDFLAVNGVSRFKQKAMWAAVRVAGKSSWINKDKDYKFLASIILALKNKTRTCRNIIFPLKLNDSPCLRKR